MKVPTIEPLEARIAPAVLSITPVDLSKAEGNAANGTTDFKFKITLDAAEPQDVTVVATASDGTAKIEDGDFSAFSQTITIPKGQTEVIFSVPIKQDIFVEADETFSVKLSSPSINAAIGVNGTATATILNDDVPKITIQAVDSALSEGSATGGLTNFRFDVVLDRVSTADVTVVVNTKDGTAKVADGDFDAFSQTITIPAGELKTTVSIPIKQDTLLEANESFSVELSAPSSNAVLGATTTASGTIINDDPPTLTIANATVKEGADGTTTKLVFRAFLSTPAAENVTFDWQTIAGTATAGVDFLSGGGTNVTIAAGQTEVTFEVTVNGDNLDELHETLKVQISNAKLGAGAITVTNAAREATGTIQNDDLSVSISGPGTITEGNVGGTTSANYSLSLNGAVLPSSHPVTVELEIVAGTALAGSDYTIPGSLFVTIPAGANSANFSVPIKVDNIFEADEVFEVRIKSVSNAIAGGVSSVSTSIFNDDTAPTISITQPTNPTDPEDPTIDVSEGTAANGEITFTVKLSAPAGTDVSFNWSTVNGTAVGGQDFIAVSNQTVTIPAGQTSATIVVTKIGDKVFEKDETFSIALSDPVNGTVSATAGTVKVKILNDEAAPKLTISDAQVFEGDGLNPRLRFRVFIDNEVTSDQDIQFNWVAGLGTATPGVDYSAVTPSVVTLAAGQTEVFLELNVNDDAANELDETVFAGITNATFADAKPVTVTDSQATGKILNDDLLVRIVAVQPSIAEGTTDTTTNAQYRIELVDPVSGLVVTSPHDVSVNVLVDTDASTAVVGSDFKALPTTPLTIPAGQSSVLFNVTVNGDTDFEANEALTLKLVDPVNAKLGTASATVTINNDGDPVPTLSIKDARVYEGATGNTALDFTVELTNAAGEDITFQYSTIDGSAIGGIDFSKVVSRTVTIPKGSKTATITVALSGDTADEADETFLVQLSNAMLGSTPITITDAEATGTILNDDLTVRISGGTVTEGNNGTTNLNFVVSIPQITSHPVTVTFEVADGTAKIANGDYALPPQFTKTIAPGETSATISIPINGDTLNEQNETLTVKLTESSGAKIDVATATGTILNDDAAPTLSINDKTTAEGNNGTTLVEYTITLSEASGQDVQVLVTPTGGTAILGSDFSGEVKTLTIPAGQTEVKYSVLVNGDLSFENDENFTVVLSNASGATIVDAIGAGTITNDDSKPILNIADASVDENAGVLNFTITLDVASGQPVTFTAATLEGLAKAGVDFTSKTQNFTIPAGQISATFSVSIINDALFEADETLQVQIGNVVGATEGNTLATGTIENDDVAPSLSIADLTVVEGDSGTKEIEVVVSLSSLAGSDITFNWATVNGTADSSDYTAVSTSPMTIAAGQSTARIKFTVVGDTNDEVDDTFTVNVSDVKLADGSNTPINVTDSSATVKLLNDDLSLSVGDATQVEGDSGDVEMLFTVTLSAASTHEVTVKYATQDGTATSTLPENAPFDFRDFVKDSGTITFAPGETTKTVAIKIRGDQNFDGTDQFKLVLSENSGAKIADGEATGTITDDDDVRPEITIDAVTAIAENADKDVEGYNGSSKYEFKIRLNHASDESVEVSVSTLDGTAVGGSDFTAITNQRITFAPGEVEKTITVTVLNDQVFEADQSFKLVLSDPLRATLGAAKEQTGTITDDGDAKPTLQIVGQTVLEGNNGEKVVNFVIQRTGATDEPISFDFNTLDGTIVGESATSSGPNPDYVTVSQRFTMAPGESSLTIPVKIKSDATDEADEQFQGQITNITNANLAEGTDGKATSTILNDDITVSLSQGVVQVLEGNAGQTDMVFTVTVPVPSDHPIEVTYVVNGGTATMGTDFLQPMVMTVTIPAHATTAQIRIPIAGDTVAEAGETLSVTLTGAKHAELATSDLTATGTILNDDAAISISDGHLVEGTSGTSKMVFTVTLDAPFSYPVTVNYATADGSATVGSDYTATQGTITFAVGETSKLIEVPIVGDTSVEGDETFSVILSNASGASILDGTGKGTIQDDESFFSIDDVSIDEGDAGTRTINFTVSRAPGSSVGATVRVSTVDGTAISTGLVPDFVSKSEVLTFGANETTKTFSVVVNSDRVFELGTETFSVVLSDATGALILDGQGTGTINNGADNAPSIRINDATVLEGAEGTKVLKFTIALSEASDVPVTFDFKTDLSVIAGAEAGSDYTAVNGTYTIPAGQKTFDVEVVVNGDTDVEADEFLLGKLSNAKLTPPGGGAPLTLQITDGEAVGTILNDDLVVSIVETASGLESGSINVRINLLDANGNPVTATRDFDIPITLQIAEGTAKLGTDFTAPSLTATILKGQTFVDIEVQIANDTIDENNETFTVTLAGATNAQLGNTVSTVTITDDDNAPALTVADVSVIEGQNAVFTVKLSAKSEKDVVVKWVTEFVPDSADPSDFTHKGVVQTLTIPAGQLEGTISVATTNDSADEFAETFKLRILSTTENATMTGDITATATIEANDFGAFSIGDASVIEGASGTKTLAFTVSRSASNLPASVKYFTSDGTAKDGVNDGSNAIADYLAASGTLDFAAGESSKTILITINGDNTSEIDETFFVGLSDAVNGTVADTSATGKILNDEVTYRIAFADADGNLLPAGPTATVTEGDTGQQFVYFYVIREGATGIPNALNISGTVFYSTGQDPTTGAVQATAGTDYLTTSGTVSFTSSGAAGEQRSALLKVPISADLLAEGDESFQLKLSNPVNGQLSETESAKVVTITDDDRQDLPHIIIANATLAEGASGATSEMVFKVKLVDSTHTKAQAAGGAITVSYSTADLIATVTDGDYTPAAAGATITFAAGETEKEIRIPILGDSRDEVSETFNVKIDGAVFKVPGTTTELPLGSDHLPTDPAVGTITNDDLTITLDPLSQFVEGNGTNTIAIVARLSQASEHAVKFTVKTQDGTAVSGATGDFLAIDNQVIEIPAGLTEFTFNITVNGDVYGEADETFNVLLSNPVDAVLGTTSKTVTILNDDAMPTLSIGDASIVEGDGAQANLVFTVVLSGATREAVTVDYKTVDGTAKSSGALIDFLARSGKLTFDPSSGASSTRTIEIPIRGDTWKEVTENFTVELSNAKIGTSTTGVTISDATATGQIVDNGDTILGIIVHDTKVVEGNSGTSSMQFTIETTAPVEGSAISLIANTRVGTANSADFTALVNQAVTIGVGQTQTTVTVLITGDGFYEAPEHLLLDITGFNSTVKAVNGSSTTATAPGVILNDDVHVVSDHREIEFVDTDGDLVTLKFSKGTIRTADDPLRGPKNVTFTAASTLGGVDIDLINLAINGFDYEGISISVTAKPQVLVTGEILGDAKANVGTLTAATLNADLFQISSGIGLGKVNISGNLGQLITGSTKRPLGAALIEVGSFGSDSNQGSVVLGPIGKMVVHGDFMGNMRLIGDAAAQPIPGGGVGRINTLIIEGKLKGGTNEGSGRITFTGGIGSATIGGIEGGTGRASATLVSFSDEFNTAIGSLTVLGDITGGTGVNSGLVEADRIGKLTLGKMSRTPSQQISGSIVGGSGELSGVVSAQTIGSVSINGDIRGGSGDSTGYLTAQTIGNVTINGDIRGDSGDFSGYLRATESLGNVRLTGSVIGGSSVAASSGQDSASGLIQTGVMKGALVIEGGILGGTGDNAGLVFVGGNAKSITLGKAGVDGGNLVGGSGKGSGRIDVNGVLSKFLAYGDVKGGKGESSGSLLVNNSAGTGGITSAVIKGDLIGGSTDASGVTGGVSSLIGSGYIEADRIGSITVEGTIRSGENNGTALAKSGGIHVGDSIGTLKVGSVEGNADTSVVISAVRSIGKATFGRDVEFLELLAGYSVPNDVTKPRGVMVNAGATMGNVTFNGTLSASSIVAGAYAGTDGEFGTSDDVETANGSNQSPGNQGLISRIASVVIKQVGTDPEVPINAIVAEQVNALKIAGKSVKLTSGAHNDGPGLVGPTGSTVQIFEI